IMAMRVYALYRNSRLVLISIMALWLSIVAIGCWAVFTSNVASLSSTDVMPSGQLTGNVGCPSVIAIAWGGQLLYDLVIFLLTIIRSLRMRKEGIRDITDILLRDGMSIDTALPLRFTPINC
ncbi:hypothetical protein SCLCIDRAFT_114305, partial [Scleroderma citrinum Foug A]